MCPLFCGGSLVDNIYRGLFFLFIHPVFVFWLGNSTHLCLRWFLISMIPLPFTLLFWVQVYTPFLCFLSKEDPLAFVGELVWWCWILSAFAGLESFWFLLHIWMRSLLGTVIWAVGNFLSSLYVLPFPPGLKSFYWKINCYPYGNPLVCYLLFFLCCF